MPDRSALADEMKSQEFKHRRFIDPQSWAVLRIDGRAFHTWTRGLSKPFDQQLMDTMDATAVALCEEVQGAVLAYTQSDEISVIFTDTQSTFSQQWFGGNVQKIVSIAASTATCAFNDAWRALGAPHAKPAYFDARVFTLPPEDVIRYLIWRYRDSQKNAVSMLAQSRFSHRALQNKNTLDMLEMLGDDGTALRAERHRPHSGAFVTRHSEPGRVTYTRKDTGETITTDFTRQAWAAAPAVSIEDVRSLLPALSHA